jgi:hypothetical protein
VSALILPEPTVRSTDILSAKISPVNPHPNKKARLPERNPGLRAADPMKFQWAKRKPLTYWSGALDNPAVTYSPTGATLQYHRRNAVSLLCSEWEQVVPTRYRRRKTYPLALTRRGCRPWTTEYGE